MSNIAPAVADLWNRTAQADRLVEAVLRHRPRLDAAGQAAFNRCDRPGAATDADLALLTAVVRAAGGRI